MYAGRNFIKIPSCWLLSCRLRRRHLKYPTSARTEKNHNTLLFGVKPRKIRLLWIKKLSLLESPSLRRFPEPIFHKPKRRGSGARKALSVSETGRFGQAHRTRNFDFKDFVWKTFAHFPCDFRESLSRLSYIVRSALTDFISCPKLFFTRSTLSKSWLNPSKL